SPSPSPAWSGASPRGTAGPWLDAWLTQLLPDPATVLAAVRYQDAAGDHEIPVTLRDLGLRPLDALALTDVEARILYAAAVPAGATAVEVAFASFSVFLLLAESLATLVGAARPLGPQDLTVPEVDAAKSGGAVDLADLRARASAALASLESDLAALTAAA